MAFENKGAMAATVVVAASDSLNKAAANYVCPGAADDVVIQEAIDAVSTTGGKVVLLDGIYNCTANIDFSRIASFTGPFVFDARGAILRVTANLTQLINLNPGAGKQILGHEIFLGRVDLNKASYTCTYGIYIRHFNDNHLFVTRIVNGSGDGIFFDQTGAPDFPCANNFIEVLSISTCDGVGIKISDNNLGTGLNVVTNHIKAGQIIGNSDGIRVGQTINYPCSYNLFEVGPVENNAAYGIYDYCGDNIYIIGYACGNATADFAQPAGIIRRSRVIGIADVYSPNMQNVFVVSKNPKNNFSEFGTIQDAINYAATRSPSSSNPLYILIHPGVYEESITTSSYVNLIGLGSRGDVVVYRADNDNIFTLAGTVKITNVTVRLGAPTAGRNMIIPSGVMNAAFINCVFECTTPGANNIIIFLINTASTLTLDGCYYDFGGTGTHRGVANAGTAGTFILRNNNFNITANAASRHISDSIGGTWTGELNRFAGTALTFNVSAGTFTFYDCDFDDSGAWVTAGATINIYQSNKTQNSGLATVLSGNTSIVVNHGLATTPTRVLVTPAENPTNAVSFWWVDTFTATQFTIHVNTDPGASNLDFHWHAQVGEQ